MRDTFTGAIHRAELIVKLKPGSANLFANPPSLIMQARNTSGTWSNITELSLSSAFFNGNFESGGELYRFNISVYLQEILRNRRTDSGVRLVQRNQGSNPDRFVLLGSDDMTVNLTISKDN
jgi:hypothetical protein